MRLTCMSLNRMKAAFGLRRCLAYLPGTAAFLVAMAASQFSADARVLTAVDLERISTIKKLSIEVMTDVTMLSRRPDLSAPDSDCIKSTLRMLMQVSQELQSYEYLITIENQLNDVGDDESMRSILRFAVENALKVLETERKHLGEISEQCSRYPLSAGKTKQATQFIEATTSILKSIQPRL